MGNFNLYEVQIKSMTEDDFSVAFVCITHLKEVGAADNAVSDDILYVYFVMMIASIGHDKQVLLYYIHETQRDTVLDWSDDTFDLLPLYKFHVPSDFHSRLVTPHQFALFSIKLPK
jgi:hypothetical protein